MYYIHLSCTPSTLAQYPSAYSSVHSPRSNLHPRLYPPPPPPLVSPPRISPSSLSLLSLPPLSSSSLPLLSPPPLSLPLSPSSFTLVSTPSSLPLDSPLKFRPIHLFLPWVGFQSVSYPQLSTLRLARWCEID